VKNPAGSAPASARHGAKCCSKKARGSPALVAAAQIGFSALAMAARAAS
jgi:hypothetical protein